MRVDSIGMFWQDLPTSKKRGERVYQLQPIPDTGWTPPKYYPNLSTESVLSIDTESYDPELDDHGPGWSRDPDKFYVCGFSVGTLDGHRWYFPIRHAVQKELNLDPDHTLSWLRDTVRQRRRTYIGANLLYDVGGLITEDIDLRDEELIDVQFGEALLEERARVALQILGMKYVGHGKTKDQLLDWCSKSYGGKPTKEGQAKNFYRAPPSLMGPYGEGDADLPILVAPHIYKRLESEGLLDLWKMECGLIPLLVSMRYAGVRVDTEKASILSAQLKTRAVIEQAKLDSFAGMKVDIGASASLAKAFDRLGLKYPRTEPTKGHPKGQPSFRKEFLKKLNHPVGDMIREIRRLEKLSGTFLDGYIIGGAGKDSKIHGSFHPLRSDDGGTIVGRFSSSHPNLQNLPIRDKEKQADGSVEELGKAIRSAFLPDEGHIKWIKMDYSQIQYRLLVHYAIGPGSEEARQRYRDNPETDFHQWCLELVESVFGSKLDRRPIKNINFGLSFGMGEEKLLLDLMAYGGVFSTHAGAKKFLETYHKGVPFLKPTNKAIMDDAAKYGVICGLMGRRARFELWEPARWGEEEHPALPFEAAVRQYGKVRRAYIHKALNRLLQMDEATIMKRAMWKCWKSGVFHYTGVPRLTVHDELDFSDPGGKDDGFEEIHRIMESETRLNIPILVEDDRVNNWGEAG